MYAVGDYVWYHSRSRGGPLLATVIGPSPSGPEFLHIQYLSWMGATGAVHAVLQSSSGTVLWCNPPPPPMWGTVTS